MQNRTFRFKATVALFAGSLVTVAACSSSAGSGSVASSGSILPMTSSRQPDAAHGDLFAADSGASEVFIFPALAKNPQPSGKINNGVSYPYNLAVDGTGTLYVQNNNNTITEYPVGKTHPSKTLNEPVVGYGTGVTVTVGRDGTVYSADHLAGQVYEFKSGGSKPETTLQVSEAFGLALDSRNNLYVGWSNSESGYGARVMKFKPGSTSGKDLGISVKLQGGIAIDSHDNLLVGDQANHVIDIFKKGQKTPFRTIDTSPYNPYQFALDRRERHLYLVGGAPIVLVYDYGTGELAWTDSQGFNGSGGATGVALRPSAAR